MSNENNHNAVRFIVEERAKTQWTETDVAYQDVDYKPQKDRPYIALNILFGESENYGLSSMNQPDHPVRENGVLLIQCYEKVNFGSEAILVLAGKARQLYQNTDENGLAFYAGNIFRVGEDGDFLRYDVEIPFYYQNPN